MPEAKLYAFGLGMLILKSSLLMMEALMAHKMLSNSCSKYMGKIAS